MRTFTEHKPDRLMMALAAADSMRGVGASRDNWPRDTQWRGWCATGHESASWWPLFVVEFKKEYITASFTASLLKRSENEILGDDVSAYELRTPWIDMRKYHA